MIEAAVRVGMTSLPHLQYFSFRQFWWKRPAGVRKWWAARTGNGRDDDPRWPPIPAGFPILLCSNCSSDRRNPREAAWNQQKLWAWWDHIGLRFKLYHSDLGWRLPAHFAKYLKYSWLGSLHRIENVGLAQLNKYDSTADLMTSIAFIPVVNLVVTIQKGVSASANTFDNGRALFCCCHIVCGFWNKNKTPLRRGEQIMTKIKKPKYEFKPWMNGG